MPATLRAEPLREGEVTLDLRDGAARGGAMVLTLGLRADRWDPDVWGRAVGHNFGQHPGRVVSRPGAGDRSSLAVDLTVTPDTVGPGGRAEYALVLRRHEDAFGGSFTGVFCDEPVSGTVHGVVSAPGVAPVAGHRPLEPSEHPRLIFRGSERAELDRRKDTPEGKAIMAMLTARAPLRLPGQVTDRHTSWMAANWGALYQLTGDREAAAEARRVLMEEVVAKPLPADRDDIQQGPRLLGAALTYDLCFEAWDEDFRRYLAEFLMMTAEDLYRGYLESLPVLAERVDPVPWRHRNAVRVSCAGVAALVVLGDPDSSGKPLRDAARLARAAERDVAEWLRDGLTASGSSVEGPLQKSLALANGVLAFIHANRTAMGRDMTPVNPMLLAGHVLAGRAGADGAPKLGISSISVQASGRWPMGMSAVPDALRGVMRWCMDRDVGLAGKQHFDCAYPYQAAYALVNYPFGVEAKAPADGLPLFVADARHGHVLIRNRWRDSGDIVAVVEFNSLSLPGLDPRTGPQAGALRVSGLGGEWVNGVVGLKPLNAVLGAELLYAEAVRPGRAVAGARMDPAYRTVTASSARRVEKPPEWGNAPKMRFDPPVRPAGSDAGIRCTRHVAVDYTGAAGVPAVFVIVDQLQGAGGRPWQFPVSPGAAACVVGDPAGTNLTWQFAAPVGAGKVRPGSALPGDLCVAVATVQAGRPPALKSLSAADGTVAATLGDLPIRFDGRRIRMGRE